MPKSKKTKKSKTNKSKKKSKIAADRKAEIDDKTQAVFQRKGYKVLTILGAGAFGEVGFFVLDFVFVLNFKFFSPGI